MNRTPQSEPRAYDQAVEVARTDERIRALERWQVAQNGSLHRMEAKLDKLQMWMMGSMFTALLALAGIVGSIFTRGK